MPQIIVAADRGAAFGDGAVTFRETVNVEDFDSQHFATQLVERIGWAVEDAAQAEQLAAPPAMESVGPHAEAQEVGPLAEAEQVGPDAEAEEVGPHAAAEEVGPLPEAQDEKRDERVIVQSPA